MNTTLDHRLPERLEAAGREVNVTLNEEWIASPQVARLLGIKTHTLAVWRMQDEGPEGWRRVKSNRVVYPASAVKRYMEENGLVYDKTN